MNTVVSILVSGAVALLSGVGIGYAWKSKSTAAEVAAAQSKVQFIEKVSPVITERIVTKYIDRIIEIEGKGTHVREVIEKTAPPSDNLPEYYRRLHDAAARNELPPNTREAGDAAKTVETATAFTTIDGNYRSCHANAEQLISLQQWVEAQRALAR